MKQLIKQGLRKCCVCTEIKELKEENFDKSKWSSTGYGYVCRPCSMHKLAALKAKTSDRLSIIDAFGKKCAKCGVQNDHPSFFDIDHIKPKRGKDKRYRLSRIKDYMLLCPNCHRVKTIAEDGFNPVPH